MIRVYTDGSCLKNPGGAGGWCAIVHVGDHEVVLCNGEEKSTNNRAEMMAAISALEYLPEGSKVEVYTDSQYVYKGITTWVSRWVGRGWKTVSGGAVKNRGLWQRLMDAEKKHTVEWNWVRGHNGHTHNERADEYARAAAIGALGEKRPGVSHARAAGPSHS